jgi:hypothetical protein
MVQQLARRLRAAFESADSDFNFEATLLALAGRSAGRQWNALAVKLYEQQARAVRRRVREPKQSMAMGFPGRVLQ